MLLTPLEQFQIISLFSIKLFSLDFSFTNLFLINLIVIISFGTLVSFMSSDDSSFFFIPNNWQTLIETIYETVSQLLFDNINVLRRASSFMRSPTLRRLLFEMSNDVSALK